MDATTTAQALREERDRAADRALRAIAELRRDLDAAAAAISSATAGEAVRSDDFVPRSQYLREVVEHGSRFAALWRAAGLFDESGS